MDFSLSAFYSADKPFFHARKIINAFYRLYVKMSVIFFARHSVFEANHSRYRKASLKIGIIKTLDEQVIPVIMKSICGFFQYFYADPHSC